jgi:hypothetical protein
MASILKHSISQKELFKPIPVKQDKVNKAFTNNYFLLSQSLTDSQNSLYKYIIAKVNTIGYVKITYQLIDNYRKVLKFNTQNIKNQKFAKLNVSRKKVVEDIIFLMEVGAIIRILSNSNHFILNPCYVFTKANTMRETIPKKYAEEWMKAVESGNCAGDFGLRYFIALSENRIKTTPMGAYSERARINHYKGPKLYQEILKRSKIAC